MKTHDELIISCPDCGVQIRVPAEAMRASANPDVEVKASCPVCEKKYILKNGRLLPAERPTLNIKMTFESGKSKTVLEGDLLNESAKTMRERARFKK